MKKSKRIIIGVLAVCIMGLTCFGIAIFGDTSKYDEDKVFFCPGVCVREYAKEQND